jgi:signal peptidase II
VRPGATLSDTASPTTEPTEVAVPFGVRLKDQLLSPKFALFFAILVAFVTLDQVTKILVVRHIEYRREEIQLIDGFLSLVHAQNQGAAFGMMSDSALRKWLFPTFTVVAVVLLTQMVWQLPKNDRYQTTAVALIMSGAIGNFIDRIHKGSVTDFIRVYTESPGPKRWLIEKFGTNEWPSFNVADAAICVGIGLFVLHYFVFEKDDKIVEPDPPTKKLAG